MHIKINIEYIGYNMYLVVELQNNEGVVISRDMLSIKDIASALREQTAS